MQVDIRQNAGIKIAEELLSKLKEESFEDAMLTARHSARDDYSFAIPALYTYIDAPEQLRRNNLNAFLSSETESKFALLLPTFRLGVPLGEKEATAPEDGLYRFPGETFARSDAESALYIRQLLGEIAPPESISIYSQVEGVKPEYTHHFLFGSKSNPKVSGVLNAFSKKLSFDYAAGPQKKTWVLKDIEFGHEYSIEAPNKLGNKYSETVDYGVIQKIKRDSKVFFLIAGLGSRATKGCGYYLLQNWPQHVAEDEFAILLRFPASLDYGIAEVIDRATGEPD